MPAVTVRLGWPLCERCGGALGTRHREPYPTGFELQSFTCAACGHVMERTVIMADGDTGRVRTPA